MFEYLVTSGVRRRLLALLWGERVRGSTRELAQFAEVGFASAHSELKAMEQFQLVTVQREGNRDVYAANLAHPEAHTLERLVGSAVRRPRPALRGDELARGRLKALGAPLRGVSLVPVPPEARLASLVKGVELARHDPAVAKALPLCFWRMRDELDVRALSDMVSRPEDKHALGFFLELAGELGGDRRLLGLAAAFRDRRMSATRPFFMLGRPERLTAEFPLARSWGFTMNLSLESMRSLFSRYTRA